MDNTVIDLIHEAGVICDPFFEASYSAAQSSILRQRKHETTGSLFESLRVCGTRRDRSGAR